ncbi:hypothetical protein Q0M94_28030 (plasmid) [Deinococcus radiomollis]|uniref:hypothetical protein n=1 Tax=Deinococcus radiomollis TaxID=468916 RepID=UPI0038925A5B
MNGCTWALLSAYASFLSQVGERNEAQRLTQILFPLEPSGRDLSEAMASLEDRGLMAGHRLTLKGVELAEGLAKAADL